MPQGPVNTGCHQRWHQEQDRGRHFATTQQLHTQGTECSSDLHTLGRAQQFLRKCTERQLPSGLQQLPQKAASPQFGGTKDTRENVVENRMQNCFYETLQYENLGALDEIGRGSV